MILLDLESRLIKLPISNGKDIRVRWQAYHMTTAIVHLGPSRQAGHYRVAAFIPDVNGFGRLMITS